MNTDELINRLRDIRDCSETISHDKVSGMITELINDIDRYGIIPRLYI